MSFSTGSHELTLDYSLSVSFSRTGSISFRNTLPQGAAVPVSANGTSS